MVALRLRKPAAVPIRSNSAERVSIVRPINGLEYGAERCLESGFLVEDPNFALIFCAQSEDDPAIPLVRELMARHPKVVAVLLCGDDPISGNPKLNNMAKGWAAADGDWILFADGNTLLPRDHLARHMNAWTGRTGVVTTVFVGVEPSGFWSAVECAFLNPYQARWWYFLAWLLPSGFCHGKSMLVRRSWLASAGGMEALARELAEDIALAKLVRDAGKDIVPVWCPVRSPLGPRSASTVLDRQARWARLRRLSYPAGFALELLSGPWLALASTAAAAATAGLPWPPLVAGVATLWYGAELVACRVAGFPLSWLSVPASLVRDAAIPGIWLYAVFGRRFRWAGKAVYQGVPKTSARPDQSDARKPETVSK